MSSKVPFAPMSIDDYTAVILAVTSLARLSFTAAFGKDLNSEEPNLPELAEAAIQSIIIGDETLEPQVLRDLEVIHKRATGEAGMIRLRYHRQRSGICGRKAGQ